MHWETYLKLVMLAALPYSLLIAFYHVHPFLQKTRNQPLKLKYTLSVLTLHVFFFQISYLELKPKK